MEDFSHELPCIQSTYDGVWVIVDRFTKSAYFLPVRQNYKLKKLVKIFMNHIVKLDGVLSTIVSNKDLKFNSRFWKAFHDAMGTQLLYSIAYHPRQMVSQRG